MRPQGTYTALLRQQGFLPYLWAQALGAFNDNLYKMIVSLLLLERATQGGSLSLTALIFVFPSIIFSGYAGFFADRFSKKNVLICAKVVEIAIMLLACIALGPEHKILMLSVLFILATQATFFSPAKYGILPEMVSVQDISRANGLVEMTTLFSILLGGIVGGLLMLLMRNHLNGIGIILVIFAGIGFLFSLRITTVPVADTARPFSWKPYQEIRGGLHKLFEHRFLLLIILAISYFWAIGIAIQVNLFIWGREVLALNTLGIALLQAALGFGVAVGSLWAGKLSDDQIEYGLIPLGALGMAIGIFMLSMIEISVLGTYSTLFVIGVAGGLYIVPLNALLQEIPPRDEKGQYIGVNNFLNGLAMVLASSILWSLQTILHLSSVAIFVFLGLTTCLLTIALIKGLPDFFLRIVLFIMTRTLYRLHIVGDEYIPRKGPALLVCNHVSYVDGLILSATVPRFIRYLIYRPYYEMKAFNWLFRLARAIPIEGGDVSEVRDAIEKARLELREGHVVCIFAEGSITRTGNLLAFHKGLELIMKDLDVPIIPVHLDQLSDSIFSYQGERNFLKLPRRIPLHVTVSFGEALPPTTSAADVRQAVQFLSSQVPFLTKSKNDFLSIRLLKSARFHSFSMCMTDSTERKLSYGAFIARALLLSKRFKKMYADEQTVAILLPAGIRAALVNVALTFAGKVSMNLTYGSIESDWRLFIDRAAIKTVITSHEFMDILKKPALPEMVYYEDFDIVFPRQELFKAWLMFVMFPARMVVKHYGALSFSPDNAATILFSRGTTSPVQGVLLSHRNILANVSGFSKLFYLNSNDRMVGVLPFYTAYGYTGTLWLPLIMGMGTVFHGFPNHEPAQVGRLIAHYHATILFDIPSGYAAYLKTVYPPQFTYLRYAIVGGAPLTTEFTDAFQMRFDLELLEGYGCTEMGPAISINVPDVRIPGRFQRGQKRGSVGQPFPNVAIKIVDPVNYKPLEMGQEGLLLTRGAGRMLGYLAEPEDTQAVFYGDWYITGDLASIDEDGFLFFSKRV